MPLKGKKPNFGNFLRIHLASLCLKYMVFYSGGGKGCRDRVMESDVRFFSLSKFWLV